VSFAREYFDLHREFVMPEMFFVFILLMIVLAVWEKATRVSRKQREFEKKLQLITIKANQQRGEMARQSLLSGMKELASMVNKELKGFEQEIPPRIFKETKDSINKYVESLDFDNLHSLYNVLANANNNTVLRALNNFAKPRR
jgi:hypothetical protein